MRVFGIILTLWLTALATAAPPRAADPIATQTLPPRIDRAIARAVAYLWHRYRGDHWDEEVPGSSPREYGGRTALCVYALLSAGQSHQSPRMAATIDWLLQAECPGVYARSLRVSALSMLVAGKADEALAEDLRWLLEAGRPDGAYDYTPSGRTDDRWDNSNTQMALLAVWSAAERGLEVPASFWRRAERHWVAAQTGDGGWSYDTAMRPAYGSMSAAGLASLYICYDTVHRDRFSRRKIDTTYPPIQRGLTWLAKNFSAIENPGKGTQYFHYYLYAVQRVGSASGHKYFGGRDWYAEGAAELLRTQGVGGGWGNVVDTCFALLFLARGRHPVLFNKLQYDGAWNTRPRDMAHLTSWIQRTFETPVRWQVLDGQTPEPQWHDAPILYISGAAAPRFSQADVAKLRAYALKGGLILSEAAWSSPAFNLGMQKAYRRIFPDLEPAPIDPDHRIFQAHAELSRPMKLLGVSNGVRLLAVHSPSDLSRPWQANAYNSRIDPFRLAANIYFHATDFGSLRQPAVDARPWHPVPRPETSKRTIRVALLTHEGNANPEPLAYTHLAAMMAERCATELDFSPPIQIAELPAKTFPVAVVTGTQSFTLSPPARRALREFLNAGGLLIADAAGGSDDFDKAARAQLLTLLDDSEPQVARLAATSEIYTLENMSIDEVTYRRAARAKYGRDRRPRLLAVSVDNRPAVIYSRDDLTAALVGYRGHNVRGYAPESAFALMRNLLIYAATRDKPSQPLLKDVIEVQWGEPES